MKHYSNPRMESVIENWPIGSQRTTATFGVEVTKRGERGTRYTINPKTGKPNATKVLTYAKKVRIVDGDDGKTYFIELTMYGFISVMQWNMQYQEDAIFESDSRFAETMKLFDQVPLGIIDGGK